MHKIKNKGTTVIVRRLGDLLRRTAAPRRLAGAALLRFAFVIVVVVRFRVCFVIIIKFGKLTESWLEVD
jgi:hypothetical protein